MHIETLKTFCDLVETQSFSKAAQKNLVSQSAVSQQVRALESRFGQPLIERGHKTGAFPTEAGELFYAEAKELWTRFAELEERLRDRVGVISGNVRIATVYSVGLHVLPPYLKRFLRDHPQVNVRLEYKRTNEIYEGCRSGELHFGIVALPTRKPQIEIEALWHDTLVFVCSPEHPLALRRTLRLAQLEGQRMIAFDRDIPTRKAIDRILRDHGVTVVRAMEFDNIETIKRSVEAGLGISILPDAAVANEVRTRSLVALPIRDGKWSRAIGVIRRRGRALSPAAESLLARLRG
jgi:DNA-binding transcriptional LysR family regulator